MEKFKYKNTFLIIYLLSIIIMFTFLVPFNILATTYSSQKVPHTAVMQTIYDSIFYTSDYRENSSTTIASLIDYKRLLMQIFFLTVVCGIPYLVSKPSKLTVKEIIDYEVRLKEKDDDISRYKMLYDDLQEYGYRGTPEEISEVLKEQIKEMREQQSSDK